MKRAATEWRMRRCSAPRRRPCATRKRRIPTGTRSGSCSASRTASCWLESPPSAYSCVSMATAPAAAAPPQAAPMSFRDVLRIDVMRRVWYAQIVSLFGDFLALFAVIAVVSFTLHGTPNQITSVQIFYMLPMVFVGPIAGVFVDRWPLKPTLVASDLIRAVLALLLIPATSVWQVYLVLAALSCVSAFFGPAQQVTIRTSVPANGLISANALMQIAFMGMRIVGPATAGTVAATFGAGTCYATDVVSFLVSAALIGSVVIRRPAVPASAHQ